MERKRRKTILSDDKIEKKNEICLINFYHHSETIEILPYYINNIKNLIKYTNGIDFYINILTSDIKKILEPINSKYNKKYQYTGKTIKLKEKKDKYIYGLCENIELDDIKICIIELLSIPNEKLLKDYYENIDKLNDIDEKINFFNEYEKQNKDEILGYLADNDNINNLINLKKKLKENNINIGIDSIGFKRYFAQILSLNYLCNSKYNDSNVYNWQIDYSSMLGIPAIYMKKYVDIKFDIDKIDNKIINNLDNNKDIILFHHRNIGKFKTKINKILPNNQNNIIIKNMNILLSTSNFWYEGRQFINNNSNLIDEYNNQYDMIYELTDEIKKTYKNRLELFVSKNNLDFFHFFKCFYGQKQINNITMFAAMNIDNTQLTTLIDKDGNQYGYSGFTSLNEKATGNQTKPKTDKNGYLKIGHYDKFNIININNIKNLINKKNIYLTYNKNFTSINEDILFTDLLQSHNKVIIPHIFLAVTKCVPIPNGPDSQPKTSKQMKEFIYLFNYFDDVDNNKIYTDEYPKKYKTNFKSFVEEDIKAMEVDKQIGGDLAFLKNIRCNIATKTPTRKYTEKYRIGNEFYTASKIGKNINTKYDADNNIIYTYLYTKLSRADIKKIRNTFNKEYNFDNHNINLEKTDKVLNENILKIYDLDVKAINMFYTKLIPKQIEKRDMYIKYDANFEFIVKDNVITLEEKMEIEVPISKKRGNISKGESKSKREKQNKYYEKYLKYPMQGDLDYKAKYLKYKLKYINLKKQYLL